MQRWITSDQDEHRVPPGHEAGCCRMEHWKPEGSLEAMRIINEVIVHCTATRQEQDFHVGDIDQWHKARGYNPRGRIHCGYHYIVCLDGSIEKGRPVSMVGAHCKGHNAHSIGVVYVGGLDADGRPCDTRTVQQRAALLKLITNLVKMYRCQVHGHREYANKACPCFDAFMEYNNIYKKIVLG